MDSYYYTAEIHYRLTSQCPNAKFHNAHLLVNWVRLIKSDAEIEYMKIAINAIYEVDRIIQKDASLKKVYLKISQSKSDMQRAVDYALNSYELGLVDLIYLLNIQDKLYNISIQENKVLLDRYMNGVDLILSLGGSFEYE